MLIIAEILIGLGIGQTTAPSTTLIMNSVQSAKAGVGSAVNDLSRELSGALGIAILGSIVNLIYRSRLDAHISAEHAFATAFGVAMIAGALTLIASAITVWRFPALHQPNSRSSLDN